MTMLAPHTDRAAVHAERMLQAAKDVLADPNDMLVRTAFMRRCFNIDWLAAAIITLAGADGSEARP